MARLEQRWRGPRPARPAVAVRAHPAAGHRGRAAARRSAGCATSTCGCRRPRRRCGTTWPAVAGGAVRRHDDRVRRRASATRCSPRSAATPASCSAACSARSTTTPALPATPAPPRHHAARPRCRPTCAPTTRPTAAERARRVVDPDDRSVQVHACHGPHRQVEVLREVLVGLLQDRPDLEPRDILVMCPDIETYAPLIEAGFGLGRGGRRRPPRPRAAGAAGRPGAERHQPAARAGGPAGRARRVAGSRPPRCSTCSRSDVVRRRFRLDDDDLARIAQWVGASPASAGVSTASSGRRSRWTASATTPGGRGSTGCCWAWRCRATTCATSVPRCRSTTSGATTSTSSGGSPSCATGSSAA